MSTTHAMQNEMDAAPVVRVDRKSLDRFMASAGFNVPMDTKGRTTHTLWAEMETSLTRIKNDVRGMPRDRQFRAW
jgi:hypothetical protein